VHQEGFWPETNPTPVISEVGFRVLAYYIDCGKCEQKLRLIVILLQLRGNVEELYVCIFMYVSVWYRSG